VKTDIPTGVDLALAWALKGHRVLPVAPAPNKRPLIREWQNNCSSDVAPIEDWWWTYPTARVGIATGAPGFDVIDFDVAGGKPGMEQLEKLLDLGILEPGTFAVVATPSGGRHLYFRGSEQRNKQNELAVPGVDFRGRGGMVLAAGNPGYRWISGRNLGIETMATVDWGRIRQALAPVAPARPPASTGTNRTAPARTATPPVPPRPTERPREARTRRVPVAPASGYDDEPGEESPLDWYTRNHDIETLLTHAGWQFAGESQGRRHYRRPGKDRDVSGNVHTMPDGRTVFYNFSSSVDLPINQAMSTGQLYAHLHHGGDLRAAAKEIRSRQMPRRVAPSMAAAIALVSTGTGQEPSVGIWPPAPTPGPPVASESAKELVPVSRVGPPEMVRGFWDQRPQLQAIRQLARERRVSPWAMLGSTLALVSCRIGPHVVLPPIVGGVASLNLLVGLVGPSGKGKGAAWAVADEYLGRSGDHMREEVGTSQGIDSCFTETVPKLGSVQFNDVAFFYVPEIDTVKAHADMAGSSLLATLRKIWSGEALGARYAAKERRRPVRAHGYRASVVAGIQPARSGVLLHDVDGGTPQRWLWLPVHDPDALRRADRPKPPRYVGDPPGLDFDAWLPQGEQRGEKDEPAPVNAQTRWEIEVCQTAQNEIIDAREASLITSEGGMDSHSLLTRLKVAANLAYLTHPQDFQVREDDWELTRPIMWISNDARAACQRALDEAEDEEHSRRGRGRAIQSVAEAVASVTIRDERAERIQELGLKVLAILQAESGREHSPRELRLATMNSRTNKMYGDDVIAAVIGTAGVVQGPETSAGGRRIRRLSWVPGVTT